MINKLNQEYQYFLKLGDTARKLVVSFSLYSIAESLILLFTNTYIWRQTNDFTTLSIYNIVYFAAIPIGFYLNGFILRSIGLKKATIIGSLMRGIIPIITVFLITNNLSILTVLAIANGIGVGLYWANRNFLEYDSIEAESRIYFYSLLTFTTTLTTVIASLIVGWFIAINTTNFLKSVNLAYAIVLVFSGFTVLASMLVFRGMEVVSPKITKSWKGFSSYSISWLRTLLFTLIYGLTQGIMWVIPGALILNLIGDERNVGDLQAIAAIISALMGYYIGKKAKTADKTKLLLIGVISFILGAFCLIISYNAAGLIIFLISYSFSGVFLAIITNPIWFEGIDANSNKDSDRSNYFLDLEIFLNIGRVLGMLLLIIFIHLSTNEAALKTTPLLLAVSQIGLIYFAIKLANQNQSQEKVIELDRG